MIWHWYSVLAVAAVGALSGFATGLLGVGGGFIIVPALKRLTRLSMASVTATSLCVISLTGGTAVLAAWQNGMLVFDTTAGAFLAAVCTGLLAGRWGVQRLPGNSVSHIFGGLLVIVALSMLISTIR
ncbi:sulfite exporter TauE/SafE family protein [Salmonella enterica subsp. enterica serovar Newport]|nr:sulfite exporter TauE/SafE family protein [Salmonella enterica subsp. enterica serovar Newport]EEK6070963.1 TSUP family transporter [Salmonella enterica subsp. enterica serovar Newport]EHM6206965.1 sulfite exporter TauE/SafE family protein [Salmonella enterica]MBJ2929851.1 sulfite exporter TauE/SafE family protein [Salmonella enterica subsp. enterica serovar Newport]